MKEINCTVCLDNGCAECAIPIIRHCRVCTKVLPVDRFFNCVKCIPELSADNGDLDYFEDVGF